MSWINAALFRDGGPAAKASAWDSSRHFPSRASAAPHPLAGPTEAIIASRIGATTRAGNGGYYRAPPVVYQQYGAPGYYAPPLVYGSGLNLNLNL